MSAPAILAGGLDLYYNKTLQKLQGTNTVIGISSDLISVKLQATEIDFVPFPFRCQIERSQQTVSLTAAQQFIYQPIQRMAILPSNKHSHFPVGAVGASPQVSVRLHLQRS